MESILADATLRWLESRRKIYQQRLSNIKFFCSKYNVQTVKKSPKSNIVDRIFNRQKTGNKSLGNNNLNQSYKVQQIPTLSYNLDAQATFINHLITWHTKLCKVSQASDGSGSKFLTQVGLGQFLWLGLVQGSHLWFEFEKFPLKTSHFSIFSLRVKKSVLVRLKSNLVKGGPAEGQK